MTAKVIHLPIGNTIKDPAERASKLAAAYADAEASDIIRMATRGEFPGRIALVSSFGAESAVLLHLVSRVAPDTPVIFLDTERHFAQTLHYRRNLARELGLTNIIDVKPDAEEAAREDADNALWKRDADACCSLRKVRPLEKALEGFDAWITGRKQFHGGARVKLPVVERSARHFKVNPIVSWRPEDIDGYFYAHRLPKHPLVSQGFPSIGCWPCTHPVKEGEDARAGRWRGQAKTECGIHNR